jgi:hypothetical protein
MAAHRWDRTGLYKSLNQRHKVLGQRLLRRTHRWGRQTPVSCRRPYGATEKTLLLVEYINIGVLCAVERLQKGITALQEEHREASQYDRLLHGCAIEAYNWGGQCHTARSLSMAIQSIPTTSEVVQSYFCSK